MRAPPSSSAAAKPTAWAAVVIVAATLRRSLAAEFHHRGGRRARSEANADAHGGAPRKQPEHIGRQREEPGAHERSADTPQDCGATADIIGHIAERHNGGYDDG